MIFTLDVFTYMSASSDLANEDVLPRLAMQQTWVVIKAAVDVFPSSSMEKKPYRRKEHNFAIKFLVTVWERTFFLPRALETTDPSYYAKRYMKSMISLDFILWTI